MRRPGVRGEGRALHRDRRATWIARCDERAYPSDWTEEQRCEAGCTGGRIRRDFLHGLLVVIGAAAVALLVGDRPLSADSATLTIRVLNLADVGEDDVSRVLAVTRSVYAAAGIDVTWVSCSVSAAPCSDPLRPNEIWLRMAPGSATATPGRPPLPLGFANVDPVLKTGVIATIYVSPTARLAQEASMPSGTLLGWVAAHEVGHLLFGSTTHQRTGLMRAGWSAADLRDGHLAEEHFSADEAARLRAGLARRTAQMSAF